jgi:hypothetical protein
MPRPEEAAARTGLAVQELMRRINEDSRRIRDLEQRMEGVESKAATLEGLTLQRFKSSDGRLAEMAAKMRETEEALLLVKAAIDKLNKHIERTALKVEVKELEKAFELLRPGLGREAVGD